jgi:hypothetical protein
MKIVEPKARGILVSIDLRLTKGEVGQMLPPGHPGREALLAQPDELDVATFDGLFPTLVRLLRLRSEG